MQSKKQTPEEIQKQLEEEGYSQGFIYLVIQNNINKYTTIKDIEDFFNHPHTEKRRQSYYFHSALLRDNEEVARYLLNQDREFYFDQYYKNQKPSILYSIMDAVSDCHGMIDTLLDEIGIDVWHPEKYLQKDNEVEQYWCDLWYNVACYSGSKFIGRLLDGGADLFKPMTGVICGASHVNYPPFAELLYFIHHKEKKENLNYLLERGIDLNDQRSPSLSIVAYKNYAFMDLKHVAAQSFSKALWAVECIFFEEERQELVKLLVQYGADPKVKDVHGLDAYEHIDRCYKCIDIDEIIEEKKQKGLENVSSKEMDNGFKYKEIRDGAWNDCKVKFDCAVKSGQIVLQHNRNVIKTELQYVIGWWVGPRGLVSKNLVQLIVNEYLGGYYLEQLDEGEAEIMRASYFKKWHTKDGGFAKEYYYLVDKEKKQKLQPKQIKDELFEEEKKQEEQNNVNDHQLQMKTNLSKLSEDVAEQKSLKEENMKYSVNNVMVKYETMDLIRKVEAETVFNLALKRVWQDEGVMLKNFGITMNEGGIIGTVMQSRQSSQSSGDVGALFLNDDMERRPSIDDLYSSMDLLTNSEGCEGSKGCEEKDVDAQHIFFVDELRMVVDEKYRAQVEYFHDSGVIFDTLALSLNHPAPYTASHLASHPVSDFGTHSGIFTLPMFDLSI